MENPSRVEAFPVGLRVLVVDDDPTWLKILEKMLRKCSYEVTTCCLATVALNLLRERREKFDIVISDVNMPDMDGFKLLEHVGLEMDLPVIMMSVDGETSRVMKGVQHGACDYLLKPIRMKELRNIWQHVYRKKIHEVREIEGHDFSEDIQMFRSGSEDFDDRYVSGGADLNSVRKRKDFDGKEPSDQECSDSSAVKKARVVWSVDLHQKFVNAVNQIGFDKVGPKKILDLMNVLGLTRENVASHLQKYRLYLSRLQKQNEGKSYGGNTQSDFSPKGPQANFGLQSPTPVNQNNATSRYVPITQNFQAQNRSPEVYVDDVKSTVALHVKDQKEAVMPDIPNTRKVNIAPPLGVALPFKGMVSNDSNVDCKPVEPSISKHQPWSAGIPVMQFMQYPKHDHEPYSLLEDYSHQSLTSQLRQTGTSLLQTPIISISCDPEDKTGLTQIKPVFKNFKSRNNKAISPVACTIDSVSVQVEHGIVNSQDFEAKHKTNGSANWIPPPRVLSMKNEVDLISIPDDLPLCSLQNIGCFENVGLNGMEIFQYNDSTSLTDFHSNWYDGLEFNCEYLYDPVEYPIIDDCLFA